jgi:hypothetical protein
VHCRGYRVEHVVRRRTNAYAALASQLDSLIYVIKAGSPSSL